MKTMQLKMLTILLRWNNMKYSLDNTAYVINDSNCGRLNVYIWDMSHFTVHIK